MSEYDTGQLMKGFQFNVGDRCSNAGKFGLA
jgi:hypothetical protein